MLFNFEGSKGIEIRDSGKPLQKQKLITFLAELKLDELKNLYKFFFRKTTAMTKAELAKVIAEHLNFPTVGRFKEWFCMLPELMQKILYRGTFTDYIPVSLLEQEFGVPLVQKIEPRYYSSQPTWKFIPELPIDILYIHVYYDCPHLSIPKFLQEILSVWLVPPAFFALTDCRTADQAESWDNSMMIADTFPLLCDALKLALEELPKDARGKLARSGFKKSMLNELRASTGFPSFNMEGEYAPCGIDMAARFILCMYNFNPQRPDDGQEGIQKLVQAFFSDKTQHPKSWNFPDRVYLEYNVCIDHLGKTNGNFIENEEFMPPARKVFQDILLHIAQDGNWFDADTLAEYIKNNRKNFAFYDRYLEFGLKVKAETFEFAGLTLSAGYYEEFNPKGILHFYLLVRPLFKAYCFIFAALGLLEITQVTPPLVRNYRKKQYPFSIYDSLKAIRITELGRWCLGLSNKRPPRPSQEYQAIADRELLLVTVQGNSMERRLYLDKIGRRLGEDRWRISPASFIAGCINKRQIAERTDRFKSLIDPNPAPHWEQLFKKVINRAGLFDERRTDILIYNMPEDQELQEALLRDPDIKRIVRRVEGRMLAIAAKDQTKFYHLLGEHGVAHF